jgi:hypothetical protein
VSGPTISRIERGILRGLPLGTVERIADALGASVDVTLRWEGEQLDRLIDAAHAFIQQQSAAILTSGGWTVRPEVSFNHYGDRGRVDLLAYHGPTGVVLVIEVKGSLGDLQDALGRLDTKARLARSLADAAGWPHVRAVVPAFVFPTRDQCAERSPRTRRSLAASRCAAGQRSPGLAGRRFRRRADSSGS